MLTVEGLAYTYGRNPVLAGVDLAIAPGEVVSLVGPNGAGKSTLLKCINRIIRPSAGTVTVDGRPAQSYGRRDLARTVAYVPQQAGSAMSTPVFDMVLLGRAPHRTPVSARHDREVAMQVIEQLNLQPLALRPFGQLSGGERQRVLIGRALAQEGRLMLLDEPTSDLDLRHQLDAMTTLKAVAKERDVAILIAIHDLALASRFSDRLVMLSKGKVFADGPWMQVMTSEKIKAVYGVSAVTGEAQGLPYVLPVQD